MSHDERLSAPVSWWAAAFAFALTCGWIMLVLGDTLVAIGVGAVAFTAAGALVWRYGSLHVRVDDELRVGRAHLEPEYIGTVTVLDRTTYRDLMGAGANTGAWLATRPWLDTGVSVVVDDPRDRTPYWLVGSRRPEELAAALAELVQTGADHDERGA